MADMQSLVERLEKAVVRLEGMSRGPGTCEDGSPKGTALVDKPPELFHVKLWKSSTRSFA